MKKITALYKTALVLYGLLMLWLLFGQRFPMDDVAELQLVPFRTLKLFWRVLASSTDSSMRRHAWVNLLGNVAMFVPLGFLIPQIWQWWRKFWRHMLLMVAIIVMVELSQYVLRLGTCDVDDLLLNLVGTTVGFAMWKRWQRIADK